MFATFVWNALAKLVPPIPPDVDVRLRFVASTAPVMFAWSMSVLELRLTVPTGVVVLPIWAPTFSPPASDVSSTVEAAFVFPRSIVPVVFRFVAFVATKLKSVPADDGPYIVTVPAALSDIIALVAAFAWIFATFVLNAFAKPVPPIPPDVDVRLKFVASTAPVMFDWSRFVLELRLTVPTGVVVLPICAPTFSPPACDVSSTVEAAFVFPRSIVAVVFRFVAFVATKLKSVPADDAPYIVTVPAALSEIIALVAALA